MAQTATGQITGTVMDTSGAIIPDAKVALESQLTGMTRETVTNQSGNYVFPLLPVGTYSVTATLEGFSAAERSDIRLNVNQVARIDLELAVGEVTQTVEVKATATAIDTDTSTVGHVVGQRQVTELPLNGRNFLQLLFLGNGAVETSGEQGSMRQGVGSAISINGSRPTSNNYMIDGTSNTDRSLNTPAVVLSVDAIQEFKEQTATYSAQYGYSANQINIVSKSGTNALHGALFWFMRNNKLDARSFFDAGISPLRQNQFGFVAGGPVYVPKIYDGRNKTFWLVNYDDTRVRRGFQRFENVPLPDELAGRFTSTITDPMTGLPFPNNVVPESRFSRLGKFAAANFYPDPNIDLPQGNHRTGRSLPNDMHQQTYRLDQNLGKYGTIFARGTLTDFTNISSNSVTPLGDVFFIQQNTNWQVSHTVALGPNVVNESRLGFLEATANQHGVAIPQADVDALQFTGVFENLPDAQRRTPRVSMRDFSGAGGAVNAFTTSNQPMWDLSNGTTIIHGNHTIAAGINYRRWRLNRDLANDFLGDFTFQGDFTGNAVADMLLGVYSNVGLFQPAGFSVPGKPGNPRQYNFQYIAPYVQDDWKVTPRLTVNLGLRYDFRTMPHETLDRMGWRNTANPLGGMFVADKTLVDKGIIGDGSFYTFAGRRNPRDASKRVWAPRLGFAFRPFGGDKTVVRGGYGVFFDSAEGREIDGSADIFPYVSRGSYQQTVDQTGPLQTTDSLFPVFSDIGAVTPAANSFIAVIMSPVPQNPYVQQWSLGVQHQLTPTTTLEVNYLGNKGTHLLMRRNIAQALPFDPANPLSVQARKPFPNFVTYIDSDWSGNSSYNSANVKFERRSTSMVLTAVYTWAKSLDNKSAAAGIGNDLAGWQGVLNNNDVKLDRGLSAFDVSHRLVTSFIYNLPFGRGGKYLGNVSRAKDALVGGWQINGIVTFQRGFPYGVNAQDIGGLLDSFGTNRSDVVGEADPSGFNRSIAEWFNTAAFVQPASGLFGTSGRGILRAPGINNWDLSVFKNFLLGENVRLQVRWESFNTFNHTQWNRPNNQVSSPQYGQVTGARAGRINQVGMKLLW